MVIFEIYADDELLRRTVTYSSYEINRKMQLELGDYLGKKYESRKVYLKILYCTLEDSETIDLSLPRS